MRQQRRRWLWTALAHALLMLGGVTMLLPLLWMISTSLKSPAAVGEFPPEFIPREPLTWRDPRSGEEFPIYEWRPSPTGAAGRPSRESALTQPKRVVRLRTAPGIAYIAELRSDGSLGPAQRIRVTPGLLKPVKRIRLRWSNYPAAWRALQLQHNWLAFDFPYQIHLGFVRIGPFHFPGFPLRNAFLAFYLNSLMVTTLVTAGTVFTSSLAGYAFARLRFPGRDKVFLAYLATLMIPAVVTMIPVFILLKILGWIDTYAALIIPPIFSAYGTFLLRQFFLAIPRDLEEAAKIDGCGLWGVYRHVILPLSGPALATLTTFTFLHTWNAFMWPLIVINSMEKRPLMLGLYAFMSQYNTDWPLLMAASVMAMLPVIIIFLLGQRYFVRGFMLSGMKG